MYALPVPAAHAMNQHRPREPAAPVPNEEQRILDARAGRGERQVLELVPKPVRERPRLARQRLPVERVVEEDLDAVVRPGMTRTSEAEPYPAANPPRLVEGQRLLDEHSFRLGMRSDSR